jgi:hypothetical protein
LVQEARRRDTLATASYPRARHGDLIQVSPAFSRNSENGRNPLRSMDARSGADPPPRKENVVDGKLQHFILR